jgi:hypothetical protein
VIVAVAVMGMVKVAVHEIVGVLAVGERLMAAALAMYMARLMRPTGMLGRAGVGVRLTHV